MANNLDGPPQMLAQPADERAAVMTIAPEELQTRKDSAQRREQAFGSFQIGPIGSQHFDGQYMALSINEEVPFATPDFFPSGQKRRPSQR